MPTGRVPWIDFCRVYTAFFVIVRHTERHYESVNYFADLFNYRSLIFFFFLIAGYFTHRATPGQWLDIKRAKRLLWPYLFWAALAMALLVPLLHWQDLAVGDYSCLSWYTLAREMGFETWAYYGLSNIPLWFLRTLILISLFSPLLQRIPDRAMLVIILLCFAGSDILCFADAEAAERNARSGVDWLPYRLYESVLAVGFYSMGLLIRRRADPARFTAFMKAYAWLPPAASLLLLPMVHFWRFNPPIMSSSLVLLGVATTMSIGCLCERYLPRLCRRVAAWGTAAFFIYATHYILLKFVIVWLTGEYRGVMTATQALFVPPILLLVSCSLFTFLHRFFPHFMNWAALTPPSPRGKASL